MSLSGCVLVVDDEENIRTIVAAALASVSGKIFTAGSAEQAMEILHEENVDVVISDIRMPGMDGLEFLQHVKREQPGIRFLMITAHGSLDTAVKSLRFGASDFLTKPFENSELRQITSRLLAMAPANEAVHEEVSRSGGILSGVIGQSPPFRAALDKIRKAAQSDSTVLLLGESGTGKEVMARVLHDLSARKDKPFIPVNCGAIPENLIESELFGHEKGAFTGAISNKPGKFVLAEGGTVLLDEMGELPLAVQVKLLRVLQERKVDPVGSRTSLGVDFRLAAATNRNLREEVRLGRFREDLYFRLNVIPVELPPLRDRGTDILLLARHYLGHFNKRYGGSFRFTPGHEKMLLSHLWPGNVRELANVVERAVVLASGSELTLEWEGSGDKAASTSIRERKQGVEREEILKALELCRWNKTQAAQHLGVSRRGLLYKIKEYVIR